MAVNENYVVADRALFAVLWTEELGSSNSLPPDDPFLSMCGLPGGDFAEAAFCPKIHTYQKSFSHSTFSIDGVGAATSSGLDRHDQNLIFFCSVL